MTQSDLSGIPVAPSAVSLNAPPSGAQSQLQDYNAQTQQANQTTQPGPSKLKRERKPTPEGPEGSPDSDEGPGNRAANKASEEASRIKAQGGLLLGVIILILLIWLLIPTASGQTRLQLLWLTLIGRTGLTNVDTSASSAGEGPSNLQLQEMHQQPIHQPITAVEPDMSVLFGNNSLSGW